MAVAAKHLAISSRISSKTGFVEVSNGTYGYKFRFFRSSSAASDALKEERESKTISKLERCAMLEAFVDQYRASNARRFLAISFAQKHIGGSYYFVRQIIQELEFKYRMSLLGKNKDGQVRKAQEGGNPALLLKEVCHPCEIEELVPRNWLQGFPHMQNAVNGVNTSLISQAPIVSSTRMGPMNSPAAATAPAAAFASLVASASPDQQSTILGNELHPLVDAIDKEHAAKVTGMLLEMGQTEVLHLLQSPEALKENVNKALEVAKPAEQAA